MNVAHRRGRKNVLENTTKLTAGVGRVWAGSGVGAGWRELEQA